MLKMLKMDLYRILKSKMTIVMILLTVVISALVTYSISYSVKQMQTNETVKQFVQEREVGAEENDVSAGIEIQSQSEWAEEDAKISAGMLFTTFLPSGILVILLSVFAAKFVNDENKNGFIKNISGFVKGRHTIAFSKMLAIMIFTVFLFVLLFVSLMIMSLIFLGYLNFDGFADDLPIIALQLLAHFGIVALIGTCSVLFRNGGFAMTIGITFASGMQTFSAE